MDGDGLPLGRVRRAPGNGTSGEGGIDFYRLVDSKVAEWWRNDDVVWLLQQQLGKPLVG